MKKFLRRLLILAVVLVVVAVVLPLFVRSRMRSVPTWYPRSTADPVARAAAANQMDQKLIAMYRDARESARESEIRSLHAASGAPPATAPSGPVKIELTEEEINAFLAKWEQKFGWKERVSSFLTDPVVVLEDNEIILAGTVKQWDTLLSLHFDVGIEKDGKLSLKLARVMAGTLPLPRSYFNGYTQKLINAMSNKVSQLRSEADIDASGCANGPAVSLAMAELLEHSLQDEPSDPVLFLPETIGHNSRSLPVKVTGVAVVNKTLSLSLEPMTVEQREALLRHLRGPADPTETAMGQPVH
ncbi:MAG: hypothetical protein JWM97_2264 [Phycisphaerales bacterium]|jgi:hypothetical protein|nr:hypothetical protein [Phycisphaerales bacterium]MDB5304715.1 hypothetical protein [Phycisphaerales bacterium]